MANNNPGRPPRSQGSREIEELCNSQFIAESPPQNLADLAFRLAKEPKPWAPLSSPIAQFSRIISRIPVPVNSISKRTRNRRAFDQGWEATTNPTNETNDDQASSALAQEQYSSFPERPLLILNSRTLPEPTKNAPPTTCANCLAQKPLTFLKKCARCMSAVYCNRSCQVTHWGIHKKQCDLIISKPSITQSRSEYFGYQKFKFELKGIDTYCGNTTDESITNPLLALGKVAREVESPTPRATKGEGRRRVRNLENVAAQMAVAQQELRRKGDQKWGIQ
jgi:hypothetical protein